MAKQRFTQWAIVSMLHPVSVVGQSGVLEDGTHRATGIVIPLGKRSAFGGETLQGLTPDISFGDEAPLLLTPQVSSVSEKPLKNPVGSLSHFKKQIVGVLDRAITGI